MSRYELVREKIRQGWSPEQVNGRLKLEGKPSVSHETIYKFIKLDRDSGGDLYLHLRHGRRRRKKRFSIPRVRADILNRKHINTRPKIIDDRQRVGDWERDLVFGASKSAAILTMVERKTLFTLVRKVESKSPKEIAQVTIATMGPLMRRCKSITNDNGFEFRNHQKESLELGIPIYFTNPYSSWEKGTNENTNGLIRQYFQQNTNMEEFSNDKAKRIENILNHRPRKKLGFRTPHESFFKEKIALIS